MAAKITRTFSGREATEQNVTTVLNRELTPTVDQIRRSYNAAFGPVATVTAATTVTAENQFYAVDATAAPVTVTLPATAGWHMIVYVKKVDASANAVTITPDGSDTIEGAGSLGLAAQYDGAVLVSNLNGSWLQF